MAGSFFEAGCPLVLGERTFTLMPLTIKQLRGDLFAWAREEPIRRARAAQALIESCRDLLGADTDAEKRRAILNAVEQATSPEWNEGGKLAAALIGSRPGYERQLWLSAKASAEKMSVSEAEFVGLLDSAESLNAALSIYLKVNGVEVKNPPTATQPPQTGNGSTSPSLSASDSPQQKSVN